MKQVLSKYRSCQECHKPLYEEYLSAVIEKITKEYGDPDLNNWLKKEIGL